MHVEQHDIWALPLDGRPRIAHGAGLANGEALELQVHADERSQRGVVVDDQRDGLGFHSLRDANH